MHIPLVVNLRRFWRLPHWLLNFVSLWRVYRRKTLVFTCLVWFDSILISSKRMLCVNRLKSKAENLSFTFCETFFLLETFQLTPLNCLNNIKWYPDFDPTHLIVVNMARRKIYIHFCANKSHNYQFRNLIHRSVALTVILFFCCRSGCFCLTTCLWRGFSISLATYPVLRHSKKGWTRWCGRR